MDGARGEARAARARAAGVALAAAVALGSACGARTALDGSAAEGAGGGDASVAGSTSAGDASGGAAEGCPHLDTPARIVLADRTMHTMGNVASNGCSFAATWLELRESALRVVATTFRVADGAWRAAPVADLAPAGASNNSPEIAWDGSAYVVAWADESLNLQRLDEDAAPLGDQVTSFAAPGNVYLRWLQPVDDASLRIGFTGYGGAAGYDVHVAHVAADGGVLAPPAALTASGDADVAGFLAVEGETTAFWTTRIPDGTALLRARFDDAGALIEDPVTMIAGENVLVSRHGAALARDEAYVGVLRLSPAEVVVARVGPGGHVLVEGVQGGDVPVLAATGRGALGVLANGERLNLSTSLDLTIVEDGAVVATETVDAGPTSYGYAMAGSEDTLGILSGSSRDVTFRTFAP